MQAIKLGQLELLMFLFVGLTLLVLLGLVIYITTAQRRTRQAALRPKSQPAQEKAMPSEIDPNPSLTGIHPALSLFRDPKGGSIRVEIDGGVYSTMADVADPDLKRKIVSLAMDLIQFVGVLKAQPSSLAPMDKTATWREDLRAGSQAAKAQAQSTLAADSRPTMAPGAAPELEERFLAYLAEMGQSPQSVQKPSMIRSIQQSLQPKPNLSEGAHGFVQDIEEIVQGQLRANPALVPGGLHVQTGLDKRVAFVFEGQEYASVDEIPNRTAQEVIRNAIREWEDRA
jgi:hypothetical protein